MNIILCGSGGAGKTTLVNDLRKRSKKVSDLPRIEEVARKIIKREGIARDDQKDVEKFVNLQKLVIAEQSKEEDERTAGFISDRCCIDALAYIWWKASEDRCRDFIQNLPDFERRLRLYRQSMVVLVAPLAHCEDDGTRYVMSRAEANAFTDICFKLFNELKIPILYLTTRDRQERQDVLLDGIKGKQSLRTYTLSFYDEKHKGEKPDLSSVNFPFYLPKPDRANAIPTLTIYEDRFEQSWSQEEEGKTSRFIQKRSSVDGIFILSFSRELRPQVVQKTLLNGVYIQGEVFNFLGCSSSGLKSRSCYMLKGSKQDCQKVLQANGNFDEIKSVSKRMARIGLLFSKVWITDITVDNIVENADVEKGDYTFTDGCGSISCQLAQKLLSEIGRCSKGTLPDSYLPSVFQIRYQGYKGILALDRSLQGNTIAVRPSMKKFNTDAHPCIGLCAFSKPHNFGHLNRQFITLLSSLGVPDAVFLNLQRDHLDMVETMTNDAEAAVTILQWRRQFSLARIVRESGMTTSSALLREISKLQSSLVPKPEKLRILIPKSRHIFGVCDPVGVLDYGECHLRLTVGDKVCTMRGPVVVCKSPSYLLGDIRVLNAVDVTTKPGLKQLEHLVDCIVFPIKGKRPHPNEVAGSDLDGDEYFVSWDADLIPRHTRQPYDYPAADSKPQGEISVQKMISYFARQNITTRMISKVDSLFRYWADTNGADSAECERLGQTFSRVIDAGKTGEDVVIPDSLKKPSDTSSDETIFVWQKMTKIALKFTGDFQESVISRTPYVASEQLTTDFVVDVLKQSFSNLSEFAKFDFAWRHLCNIYENDEELRSEMLATVVDHVNFSLFSEEEKIAAVDRGVPLRIVLNALSKSHILQRGNMDKFGMDYPSAKWNFLCRMKHCDMDWALLTRILQGNTGVLLVLQMPEGIKLGIQFHQSCQQGEGMIVHPGSIEAFFFSDDFGFYKRYYIGADYRLDLLDDRFQLYRTVFTKTFIFIDDKTVLVRKKNSKGDGDFETSVQSAVSVDLSRFYPQMYTRTGQKRHPPVRKVPFCSLEIYSVDSLYLDILTGNYLEPVHEMSLQDDEEVADAEPCKIHIPETIMDMENLMDWMKKLASCAAWSISDSDVCQYVESCFFETLEEPFKEWPLLQVLDFVALCSRLRLTETVEQLIAVFGETPIQTKELLGLLVNWPSWWYLGVRISRKILHYVLTGLTRNHQENDKDAYLQHLASLHSLALWEETEAQKDAVETSRSSEVISDLKIDCHCEESALPSADFDVTFYRVGASTVRTKIRRGQYVVAYRQSDPGIRFLAKVTTFREAPMSMTLAVCDPVIPKLVRRCVTTPVKIYWQVRIIGNIASFMTSMDAMRKVHEDPAVAPLWPILVQHANKKADVAISTEPSTEFTCQIPSLNEGQQEAVAAALSNTITLIQGPPGTGKTIVACEIVRQALESRQCQGILVCAETNLAVDNVTRKLNSMGINILRMGNEESMAVDVFDVSLNGRVLKLAAEEARRAKVHDKQGTEHRNTRLVKRVLNAADVVLTTSASANDADLEEMVLELVVVDEATLTRTPTLLCSLIHGAKRLVLIGDPKQLGPMEIQESCSEDHQLEGPTLPSLSLLSTTLFHTIHEQDSSSTKFLSVQHRMHPELMRFPSSEFYEGKLVSGVQAKDRLLPHFPWPDANLPFCFIECALKTEVRVGTSFKNESEAKIVLQCIEFLLGVDEDVGIQRLEMGLSDIGVITPYKGQVECIREKLRAKFGRVEVATVDGFQGREKEVIVVSSVRSNLREVTGFTSDRNRINVLLTRARSGFIMIGDSATLQASDIWRRWLEQAPRLSREQLRRGRSARSGEAVVPSVRGGRGRNGMASGQGRGEGPGRNSAHGSGDGRGGSIRQPGGRRNGGRARGRGRA